MKKMIFPFVVLFSMTFLNAFDKVSLSFNYFDNTSATGISLIKNLDYQLIDNTTLSIEILSEYIDSKNDDMSIFSIQSLLNYYFNKNYFFEIGAGIAHFTKRELDNKKFGSNTQFKESIGFGYKFSENLESTLKYTHYSNADLANENSGLDFIGLRVIYKF